MLTKNFIDKSAWPDGPWKNEPDKAQWVDPETDLDCLIVRNKINGILCGYVGVAAEHPLFAIPYSDTYEKADLTVHGGLTFSDFCNENNAEEGICHVPEPGRPEKVWWLGFDCCHCWDYQPVYHSEFSQNSNLEYRTFEYVKNECTLLAKQLKGITC